MRKRSLLLWTPVVLGLALLLPATTVANSYYNYTVIKNHCALNGTLSFTVKYTVAGSTNANKVTFDAIPQVRDGGTWHNFGGPWATVAHKFQPNGYTAHSYQSGPYLLGAGNRWSRIAVTLRAWDANLLLNQQVVYSVKCRT